MNKIIIIGTIEFLSDRALIQAIERTAVIINTAEEELQINYAEKKGLDYVIPIDYDKPCYLHGVVDNEINDYLLNVARDKGTF